MSRSDHRIPPLPAWTPLILFGTVRAPFTPSPPLFFIPMRRRRDTVPLRCRGGFPGHRHGDGEAPQPRISRPPASHLSSVLVAMSSIQGLPLSSCFMSFTRPPHVHRSRLLVGG